jgi:hypothetical protein
LAKGAVAQSLIEIYRSIGGGWPSPYLGGSLNALPPVDEAPAEDIPPPDPMPLEDVNLDFPESIGPIPLIRQPESHAVEYRD